MSARKNVLLPFYAIGSLTAQKPAKVSGDMSASITGPATSAQYYDNIGVQIDWTSSDAVGTIEIQGSVDYDPDFETGTFYALTFDPLLDQPASNNGGYLVSLNQFPFSFYRVVYTRSSGSGDLNVYYTGKML